MREVRVVGAETDQYAGSDLQGIWFLQHGQPEGQRWHIA
jgi:hypothetical protein